MRAAPLLLLAAVATPPVAACGFAKSEPQRTEAPPKQHLVVRGTTRASRPAAVIDPTSEVSGSTKLTLRALRGEVASFLVLVQADGDSLSNVQLNAAEPTGPARWIPSGPDGSVFDAGLLRELAVKRRSEPGTSRADRGWSVAAVPTDPRDHGAVADPIIPLAAAQKSGDYPLRLEREHRAVLWVDLPVAEGQAPGTYSTTLRFTSAHAGEVAEVVVLLDVAAGVLPPAAGEVLVDLSVSEVVERVGDPAAAGRAMDLLQRHRVTPIISVRGLADVDRATSAVTAAGDSVNRGGAFAVALRPEGADGGPSPQALDEVAAVMRRLHELGVEDTPPRRIVYLDLVSDDCDSPAPGAWRAALARAADPISQRLRVAFRCPGLPKRRSEHILSAPPGTFTPEGAESAHRAGRWVWLSGGHRPASPTLLLDDSLVAPRLIGWVIARYEVERWYLGHAARWVDGGPTGHGPFDPFVTAETVHDDQGFLDGADVLVYPGRQSKVGWTNYDSATVFPSFRLKQLRAGLTDLAYLRLARRLAPSELETLVRRIVPKALGEAADGPATWSESAEVLDSARDRLYDLIATTQ